jgi:hypothetical protein
MVPAYAGGWRVGGWGLSRGIRPGPNPCGSRSARGAPSSPAQCRRKRKMEGSVWRTEAENRPPPEPPLVPPAQAGSPGPPPLARWLPRARRFVSANPTGQMPPLPSPWGGAGSARRAGMGRVRSGLSDTPPHPALRPPSRQREGRVWQRAARSALYQRSITSIGSSSPSSAGAPSSLSSSSSLRSPA